MRRQTSSVVSTSEVDRQLDETAYDNVKKVGDSIILVNRVGVALHDGALTAAATASTEPLKSAILNSTTNATEIITVSDNINEVVAVGNDLELGVDSTIVKVAAVADEVAIVSQHTVEVDRVSLSADQIDRLYGIAGATADAIDRVALSADNVDDFVGRYYGPLAVEPTIISHPTLTAGDLYFNTVLTRVESYDGVSWTDALTLTASSTSTLTNKTLNSVTNNVNANALHYPIKASGAINRGDVITAIDTLGDGTIVAAVQSSLSQPAIGISDSNLADNELGKALTVGTYKNYDATGLAVGQILYPDGTGGLVDTPNIGPGNYNQPSAFVAEINGSNAQLVVNFHSAHESADLISNVPSGTVTATNIQDAVNELDANKVGNTDGVISSSLSIGDVILSESTERPELLKVSSVGNQAWSGISVAKGSGNEFSVRTAGTELAISNETTDKIYMSYQDSISVFFHNGVPRISNKNTHTEVASDLNVAGSLGVSADLSIAGNLYVSGTTTTIDSTTVSTADNRIVLNAGEVGAGVTKGSSGLKVDRGTLNPYVFGFSEYSQAFEIGELLEWGVAGISGNGTTAILTTTAPHDRQVGDYMFITDSNSYDGMIQLTAVTSTTMSFNSSNTSSEAGLDTTVQYAGMLQKVATREDAPLDGGTTYWDDATSSFKTRDINEYLGTLVTSTLDI